MKNWKTTLTALLTAFFGFVSARNDLFPEWLHAISSYMMAGGMVTLGLVTKDHDVAGGKRRQP